MYFVADVSGISIEWENFELVFEDGYKNITIYSDTSRRLSWLSHYARITLHMNRQAAVIKTLSRRLEVLSSCAVRLQWEHSHIINANCYPRKLQCS